MSDMEKRRFTVLLTTLTVAILLPVLGHWLRQSGELTCTLDGQKIDSLFRVRIADEHRNTNQFCCIRCARLWLDKQPAGAKEVWVTDEASGQEIPAASAIFVRNLVVTMKSTGNRIHVFGSQVDAQENARQFRGTILHGRERPFGQLELNP